jgi:hypothetical protein
LPLPPTPVGQETALSVPTLLCHCGEVLDGDRLGRQVDAGVDRGDRRVVPLRHLAEEQVGEQRRGQLELAGSDALDVDHRDHASHDHGELHQSRGVELGLGERCVGGAEVYGLGLDLRDAAARADRLVVELQAGHLVVGLRPPRVDGVGERCAGAGDAALLRHRRSGHERGQGDHQATHGHGSIGSHRVSSFGRKGASGDGAFFDRSRA